MIITIVITGFICGGWCSSDKKVHVNAGHIKNGIAVVTIQNQVAVANKVNPLQFYVYQYGMQVVFQEMLYNSTCTGEEINLTKLYP